LRKAEIGNVTPAKAGVYGQKTGFPLRLKPDLRFRGNDKMLFPQQILFNRFFGVRGSVIKIFVEDFNVLFLHYVVDNGGRDFELEVYQLTLLNYEAASLFQ